jgi:hypothetical protein
MEFLNQKRFDDITLDAPNADKIAKLMDWYVIRLEGGTDEDAQKLLADEPKPANAWTAPVVPKGEAKPAGVIETKEEAKEVSENGSTKRKKETKEEELSGGSGSESDKGSEGASPKAKKKKKTPIEALEDALDSKSEIDGESEEVSNRMENETETISADEDEKETTTGEPKPAEKKVRTVSGDSAASNGTQEEGEEGKKSGGEEKKEEKEEKEKVRETPKPKEPEVEELPQLHRTSSVFLRNLSPGVPKAEVEALCQKYPGFLRAALADPQPDRKWYRRGWVTFKRNVNIKGKFIN